MTEGWLLQRCEWLRVHDTALIVWTVSTAMTGICAFAIAAMMCYALSNRPNPPRRWVPWAFCLAFATLGISQILWIVNIWFPFFTTELVIRSVVATVLLVVSIGLYMDRRAIMAAMDPSADARKVAKLQDELLDKTNSLNKWRALAQDFARKGVSIDGY